MGPDHDISENSAEAEADGALSGLLHDQHAADSAVNSGIAPGTKRRRETGMPELPKPRMRLNFCTCD
jgi:hypothetical protein